MHAFNDESETLGESTSELSSAPAITPRSLLRSLPAARRRALLCKSNRAGLVHLAWHLVAIGLMSPWIAFRWPLWPVVMLVQGVLLVFLFTLMHECISAMLDVVIEDCPNYICADCAFRGDVLHWRCPSCGHWDAVALVFGVEGE